MAVTPAMVYLFFVNYVDHNLIVLPDYYIR